MKRLLTALLIAFLLVSMVNVAHIEANPGTKISAPSIVDLTKGPGNTTTVDITIQDVTNLYGGEFQLTYDTYVLENTARAWGPIKTSRDPDTSVLDRSTVGNVWMVWTYLGTLPGGKGTFNGTGVIATLTFKVLKLGYTQLDLHDTNLGNSAGNPITHDEADGYFRNVGAGNIPVANFTYWPIEPLINETVTFDASESYDPNGYITDYAWDFETNGTVDAHGVIVTHAYSKDQNYTVTLVVTDNETIKSSKKTILYVASIDLQIKAVTASPTSVLKGQNVTVTVKTKYSTFYAKEPITFNVTAYYNTTTIETPIETRTVTANPSKDKDVIFQWNTSDVQGGKYGIIAEACLVDSRTLQRRGGNETSTVNNRGYDGYVTVSELHYYDIAVLDVTATPELLLVGESTITKINVENKGTDQMDFNLTLYSNETQLNNWTGCSLNGGVSYAFQYNWATKDVELGNYTLKAEATVAGVENDTSNNMAKTNVIVTKAPIANFTYSPEEPLYGVPVVFNASSSYDPDGWIIEYQWEFGDANTTITTTPIVTHAYLYGMPELTVTLSVKDNYNIGRERAKVCEKKKSITLKDASFLSISRSADTVIVGSNVTISGYISSPRSGYSTQDLNITIYYRVAGSSAWDVLARVNSTAVNSTHGRYLYNWTTTLAGIYDCKACWQGDIYRVKANSTVITVTVNKMSSTISVGVSSSSITLGSSVVISGSIVPERPGVNVTIWYHLVGTTWQPLTTVETNETGGYSFTWTPASTGKYEVQSRWEGDENTLANESDIRAVEVGEAGLPAIFLYVIAAVVIIVVAAVAAVYFIKLRKTKP